MSRCNPLPCVPVSIDQPWQDDRVACVDIVSMVRPEANCRDPRPALARVALGEIAPVGIKSADCPATEQDTARLPFDTMNSLDLSHPL
jgi:hypothetical protein